MGRFRGTPQQIVRQLEDEANAAARAYEEAVQDNERSYRVGRMEDLIDDLSERLEALELARLESLGVALDDTTDGVLILRRGLSAFEVRARDDMSISVNGKIVRPNPEFPVLTDDLYDDVMLHVIAWLDPSRAGPKRFGNV
ncbi:MAG: hypothetical protein AAFV45_04605 [Pseudomonadota bacterium]